MRFKKHISLFLAFFLLISNLGFAFDVHYCGGKVASISFKASCVPVKTEKKCCSVSQKLPTTTGTVAVSLEIEKSKCCKNKHIDFKKKSVDSIIKSFSFQIDTPFEIQDWKPINADPFPNCKHICITSYYCDVNAPLLFKLYSQFIFYA